MLIYLYAYITTKVKKKEAGCDFRRGMLHKGGVGRRRRNKIVV